MWRGWKGDVAAFLVGLVLAPGLLYGAGGAIAAYETRFCDEACEIDGGWQMPGL